MQIVNKTKNAVIANDIVIADTLFSRMSGLLGRKEFKPGQALIIKPCQSIHTFFMRFPIDVLFVDKQNRVIKATSSLKPWRLSAVYFFAQLCIELPTGTIESTVTSVGDILSFLDSSF